MRLRSQKPGNDRRASASVAFHRTKPRWDASHRPNWQRASAAGFCDFDALQMKRPVLCSPMFARCDATEKRWAGHRRTSRGRIAMKVLGLTLATAALICAAGSAQAEVKSVVLVHGAFA